MIETDQALMLAYGTLRAETSVFHRNVAQHEASTLAAGALPGPSADGAMCSHGD